MGYYGAGSGFRVNGVLVGCGLCVRKDEPLNKGVCHDCWMATYHGGNIEDISFEPEDKERFLKLEKLVRKYQRLISTLEYEAKENGIPLSELLQQFTDKGTVKVHMEIGLKPRNRGQPCKN